MNRVSFGSILPPSSYTSLRKSLHFYLSSVSLLVKKQKKQKTITTLKYENDNNEYKDPIYQGQNKCWRLGRWSWLRLWLQAEILWKDNTLENWLEFWKKSYIWHCKCAPEKRRTKKMGNKIYKAIRNDTPQIKLKTPVGGYRTLIPGHLRVTTGFVCIRVFTLKRSNKAFDHRGYLWQWKTLPILRLPFCTTLSYLQSQEPYFPAFSLTKRSYVTQFWPSTSSLLPVLVVDVNSWSHLETIREKLRKWQRIQCWHH